MTTEQLKPCPACNSRRNLYYGESRNYREQIVGCAFCEVEIHENNWNTRPIEDAIRAKLAIAVEALERIKSTPEYDSAYTCDFAGEALTKIHDQKQS